MLMTVMGRNSSASTTVSCRRSVSSSPAFRRPAAWTSRAHSPTIAADLSSTPRYPRPSAMPSPRCWRRRRARSSCSPTPARATTTLRFAQTAAQAFGGLDAVINLIPVSADIQAGPDRRHRGSRRGQAHPAAARHPHRRQPHAPDAERGPRAERHDHAGATDAEAAIAGIVRTALAAITRGEAQVGRRRAFASTPSARAQCRAKPAPASPVSPTSPRWRSTLRRSADGRSPATSSTPRESLRAAASRSAGQSAPARAGCGSTGWQHR